MDVKHITPDYAVAEQIDPADMTALAEQGFKTVINNRPDAEIPPSHGSDAMREAAEAAGLTYVFNPVVNGGMTMDMVDMQGKALAEAPAPILAYCRSGTRSSIMWALSQAGTAPTEELLAKARAAGYDLSGLARQMEALAQQR